MSYKFKIIIMLFRKIKKASILSLIFISGLCFSLETQGQTETGGFKYLADIELKPTLEGVFLYSTCLNEEGSSCTTPGSKTRVKIPFINRK